MSSFHSTRSQRQSGIMKTQETCDGVPGAGPHHSSVFSALRFSRLADIQWPITMTHWTSEFSDDNALLRSQCTCSWLSSASACSLTPNFEALLLSYTRVKLWTYDTHCMLCVLSRLIKRIWMNEWMNEWRSARSAAYRIKNNGPRTEPCGTGHVRWITAEGIQVYSISGRWGRRPQSVYGPLD